MFVNYDSELILVFFEYRTGIIAFWVTALLALSWRFSLRPSQSLEPRLIFRNFALGGITEVAQRFLAAPALALMAVEMMKIRLGWIPQEWPLAVRAIIALLILDGILYFWHRLNHIIPFLWRFHRVHHSDPQMNASTAVRFHPGEFLLATGTSALQLWITGFDPATYLLYDFCVTVAVPFHHANLRLPGNWDRRLRLLIITPELHAIHHSIRDEETQSNFGTIFSFWDRLFRTRKTREPAASIVTGVLPLASQRLIDLLDAPARSEAWRQH